MICSLKKLTVIRKNIDFSVVVNLKYIVCWSYNILPHINLIIYFIYHIFFYPFTLHPIHPPIFLFLHLQNNYLLSGYCMLRNEPGTGNGKRNKIKFLISSCLRPHVKKQTCKSIITTQDVKCCPWERFWKEYLHLSGWFELKMQGMKKNQSVVDISDRNWIKPMTIEGEGL